MNEINQKFMDNGFNKFLVIWLGEFISSIGSGLTAFGLGVYVYQMTHTAVSVSLVTLAAFLPSILLSPLAGIFADRFDRRLLMIIGDLFSGIGLFVMFIIMSVGDIQVWQICLCVGINSAFVSLLDPAYKATITDLLTKEEYAKASGLVQLASSSKYLLAPIIAGFLLSVTDIKVILIIDMLTIVVTIISVITVRKSLGKNENIHKKQNLLKDFLEGFKAVIENKGVFVLIMLTSIVTFYIGFVQTLFTPMMLSFTTSKMLGIVESISAIGMLITSLLIGIFNLKKNFVNIMSGGLFVAGIFIAGMGMTTNIVVIIGSGFIFFATLPYINTSIEVLIRKSITNEKQGRVWGLISILSQLGYVVAYIASGVLADYVFNPWLEKDGMLADSVGKIIGTGSARGIGFLFIISGVLIIGLSVIICKTRSLKELDI